MQKFLAFMNFIWIKILSYFPTALPKGMAEFELWAKRIYILSGALIKYDHMKFVLATQIMHLDSKASRVPMNVFVRLTHKAAANQVASAVFQDVKARQEEEMKAAQQVADTTPTQQAPQDVQTQGS